MGYRLFLCLWDFPIFGCILAVSLDGFIDPGHNEPSVAPFCPSWQSLLAETSREWYCVAGTTNRN
jgi:hypothetical protein